MHRGAGYDEEALAVLARRKNCRLLRIPDQSIAPPWEVRSINRGLLWQASTRATRPTPRMARRHEARADGREMVG